MLRWSSPSLLAYRCGLLDNELNKLFEQEEYLFKTELRTVFSNDFISNFNGEKHLVTRLCINRSSVVNGEENTYEIYFSFMTHPAGCGIVDVFSLPTNGRLSVFTRAKKVPELLAVVFSWLEKLLNNLKYGIILWSDSVKQQIKKESIDSVVHSAMKKYFNPAITVFDNPNSINTVELCNGRLNAKNIFPYTPSYQGTNIYLPTENAAKYISLYDDLKDKFDKYLEENNPLYNV